MADALQMVRFKALFFMLFFPYFEAEGISGGGVGGVGIGQHTSSSFAPRRRAKLNDTHFRGNISSDDIYNALFSSRRRIFSTYSSYLFGADPNTIAESTIVLKVRNAALPFIIGNSSLVYFWQKPSESEDCINYEVSNDKEMRVGFCKSQVESCLRSIANLHQLAAYDFLSPTGIRFTEFSWFCPADAMCCEWECCDVGEPSAWSRLHGGFMSGFRIVLTVVDIILIIIVGLPLIAVGCYLSFKCIDWTLKWGEKFNAEDPMSFLSKDIPSRSHDST